MKVHPLPQREVVLVYASTPKASAQQPVGLVAWRQALRGTLQAFAPKTPLEFLGPQGPRSSPPLARLRTTRTVAGLSQPTP